MGATLPEFIKAVLLKTLVFFRDFFFEKPNEGKNWASDSTQKEKDCDEIRAKVKISLRDLKIISSALLHLKRELLRKNEMEKAEELMVLDKKIYELILELEKERKAEKESVSVAA